MDLHKAKFTTRFWIDLPKEQIYLFCNYDGNRIKIYTKEKITKEKTTKKFWHKESQRAKDTIDNPDHERLNNVLKDIETTAIKVFRNFISFHKRKPSPSEFRNSFNKEHFEKIPQFTTEKRKTLLDTFDEYIETKKVDNTDTTANRYLHVKNGLIEFGKLYNHEIQFENINVKFRNDLVLHYQKTLSDSTVYRRLKYFKTILSYALRRKYIDKLNIELDEFLTKDRESNKIALSEYELHELENLDLSENPRLDRVRDRFLIGIYSGLRYSDYSRINKIHIDGEYLTIHQGKVKTPITIPFTDDLRSVFVKHKYNLPDRISEPKFNEYLKELGALCVSLQRLQEVTKYIGNKPHTSIVPRYSLLGTHTARRTYVTLLSKQGIDLEIIRYGTGHTTTQALKQYVKLDGKQKADILANAMNRTKPKDSETPIIKLKKVN